jgi:hypothetical protein
MTTRNGIFNEEFNKYIDGWAEMQINIWKEKMMLHGVGTSKKATGNLYNSLSTSVSPEHDRIDFKFNRYGFYVEAGIGPEMGIGGKLGKTRNSSGRFAENPEREPKPWLSGNYWYSRKKLAVEMIEQTGKFYLASISRILEEKNE